VFGGAAVIGGTIFEEIILPSFRAKRGIPPAIGLNEGGIPLFVRMDGSFFG
jgi:hypothetical protein